MAYNRYPDHRNRNTHRSHRRKKKARWKIANPVRFYGSLLVFTMIIVLLASQLIKKGGSGQQKGESEAAATSSESASSEAPQESSVQESEAVSEDTGTAAESSEPEQAQIETTVTLDSGYHTGLKKLDEQVMGFLTGMVLSHADNHAKSPEDSRAPEKVQYLYHIVRDPAHGGEDTGLTVSGINESEFDLLIATRLRDRIRELAPQIEVLLTREDDTYVEISDRIALANDREADLYVNLNLSANEEDLTQGGVACMFWDSEENTPRGQESLRVAIQLVNAAATALDRPDNGAQWELSEILYQTNMPSVSLRMGYLTNDYDRAALVDDAKKADMIDRLAESIVSIVTSYEPHVDVNIPEVKTVEESSEESTESTWEESASEESWTEESWTEESWTEESWTEESWTEESWTEESWTEESWTEESWTEESWTEDPEAQDNGWE